MDQRKKKSVWKIEKQLRVKIQSLGFIVPRWVSLSKADLFIEEFKNKIQILKILLTFFSPSGLKCERITKTPTNIFIYR